MAVLETIRHKFGILITALIAVALLSFIVDPTSIMNSMDSGERQGEDIIVATINGHDVTYTEFYDQMNLQKDSYPFESYLYQALSQDSTLNINNSEVMAMLNDSYDENIRKSTLIKFIIEHNYAARAKDAGFNVDDQEIAEYLALFYGVDGLAEVEKQVANDASGRMLNQWNETLSEVEAQIYREKYTKYLLDSSFENNLVVDDFITASDNVYNVDFVCVRPSVEVEVTEDEKVAYYNENKDKYKSDPTRDITYLLVELAAEDIEEMEYKADSVFADVCNADDLVKAAVDNDYVFGSFRYPTVNVLSESDKLVAGDEYIYKWAFKESESGVMETFNISEGEKDYKVLAILSNANDTGYMSYEDAADSVEIDVYNEKSADAALADVTEKIKGIDSLDQMAEVLRTDVWRNQKVTFASQPTDPRFAGAVSVAEKGVINGPFLGNNGIYVYTVTGVESGTAYDDNELKVKKDEIDAEYMNLFEYYLSEMYLMGMEYRYNPGFVTDNSYLHF